MADDYQFADTPAARMLSGGLARASEERGLSMRQLGKQLGYKQAVVLSHMANGRVPIPIDRAEDFASILGLDPAAFLEAVVVQRHPDVNWSLLKGRAHSPAEGSFEAQLDTMLAADPSIKEEHRQIVREVLAARSPKSRWLSPHELAAIEIIRALRPDVRHSGLNDDDRNAIERALLGGDWQ